MTLQRRTAVLAMVIAAVALLGAGSLTVGQRLFASSAPTGRLWFDGARWEQGIPILTAPNFVLPDQSRRAISLRQFRGKVVFISFTSSVCKEQCPLVGRTMTRVERELGPSSNRTVLLNVSVDPEADTRATVQTFAREMGWQRLPWYYVWAARSTMKHVWRSYFEYVPAPPPILKPGLSVVHLAAVVMVDQKGRIRAYLPYPFLASPLSQAARDLLGGHA